MERILTELVGRLEKAHGEQLVSVILYGSAATEAGTDRLSDYNVVCVMRAVTPAGIRACEPVFRWWRDMKHPSPVLLSLEEVRTASDCFPIELTDIKERHQILFGEDVVTDLDIDYSFYRARVEYELRAKLVRLRQKAGGVLSERDLLLRLLADSISTFCVLFRHAVRLGGGGSGHGKRDAVNAAAAAFGIDPQPFLTILDVREEKLKAKDADPVALFGRYLEEIGKVIDAVDGMEK